MSVRRMSRRRSPTEFAARSPRQAVSASTVLSVLIGLLTLAVHPLVVSVASPILVHGFADGIQDTQL